MKEAASDQIPRPEAVTGHTGRLPATPGVTGHPRTETDRALDVWIARVCQKTGPDLGFCDVVITTLDLVLVSLGPRCVWWSGSGGRATAG